MRKKVIYNQNVSTLVQTSYIKRIEFFLCLPYILLTELRRSVSENLDFSCVHRSMRLVCTSDLSQNSLMLTSCLVNKSYKECYSA